MITAHPHPVSLVGTERCADRSVPVPAVSLTTATAGAWRYPTTHRSRTVFIVSLLVSAGLHAGFFFGVSRSKPKAPPRPAIELIPFEITTPQLEQLDEREMVAVDENDIPNLSPLPPMQPDLPTMPNAGDFVQAIDMSSFTQYTGSKTFKISEHDVNMGANAKVVFNLADLDRIPYPTYQIAPMYPEAMKRAGITARVVVDFIVDETGRVHSAVASDSTDREFEAAAVTGVLKWRFQAGMKGGQKVSTHMRVPVEFKLVD